MHVTIAQGTSWHMRKANIQISLCIRSLSITHEETLGPWLPVERPLKDYLVPLCMLGNFTRLFLFFLCFVLSNVLSVNF